MGLGCHYPVHWYHLVYLFGPLNGQSTFFGCYIMVRVEMDSIIWGTFLDSFPIFKTFAAYYLKNWLPYHKPSI